MKKSFSRVAAVLLVGALSSNGLTAYAADSYNNGTTDITASLEQYVAGVVEDNSNSATVNITAAIEDAVNNNVIVATYEEESVAVDVKYPQFVGIAIPNVEESLNIRVEANEESDRVGKLSAGASAQIIEVGDAWTKIQSGTVTGYVKNDYILSGDEAGVYAEENLTKQVTIDTETLYVRAEESADSDCVGMVPGGEKYKVVEDSDKWAEIQLEDGVYGYVSKEFVTTTFILDKALSVEEEEELARQAEAAKKAEEEAAAEKIKEANKTTSSNKNNSSNKSNGSSSGRSNSSQNNVASGSSSGGRGDICSYATQYVGNPYVYGGTSLTNGTDCSGFTMSVYANFGYSLPHSSSAQAGCGSEVSLDSLVPGDLVFYGSKGGINHVAMYIGNGQVVHASNERVGITISNVNYRSPICARRIAG